MKIFFLKDSISLGDNMILKLSPIRDIKKLEALTKESKEFFEGKLIVDNEGELYSGIIDFLRYKNIYLTF